MNLDQRVKNFQPLPSPMSKGRPYIVQTMVKTPLCQVLPILAKPTYTSCTLSRLMPGISFAMIYASLFTKTNRIARILAGSKKRFPKRKPLFMSATAQVRKRFRCDRGYFKANLSNCRSVSILRDSDFRSNAFSLGRRFR